MIVPADPMLTNAVLSVRKKDGSRMYFINPDVLYIDGKPLTYIPAVQQAINEHLLALLEAKK